MKDIRDIQLIIVTGMSGVGKSTTAQNLARMYEQNNLAHHWYHEEMDDHPIRWANGGEFSRGNLHTQDGMQQNVEDMYERWTKLVERMTSQGGIHVMEGCLYQNIIRYFFNSCYSREQIIAYYDRLMKILEPVNPHVIFLWRPNVKESFEKAFAVRGERWENLILDPGGEAYFDTHEYAGPESIFAMWEDYQELANTAFERFAGRKLKVDTSGEQWDSYRKRIAEFVGIRYFGREELRLTSLDKYCGRFSFDDSNGQPEVIEVLQEDGTLYCRFSWFKYIKMNALGNDEFELSAFPIYFTYSFAEDQVFIKVSGNYGWEICGKTLERI